MKKSKYLIYFLVLTAVFTVYTATFAKTKEKPKKIKIEIEKGTIEQISTDKITVHDNKKGISITANIISSTKLTGKLGEKINISEMLIGDEVKLSGQKTSTSSDIYNALNIKDKSVWKMQVERIGFIQGIISETDFILKVKNEAGGDKEYTVKTDNNTKIKQKSKKKEFKNLELGEKIIVSGIINRKNKIINANKITIKDTAQHSAFYIGGKVESIDNVNNTFVLIFKNGNGYKNTVKVNQGTKITLDENTKSFNDIKVNDGIEVKGVYDDVDETKIIAEKIKLGIIIDF